VSRRTHLRLPQPGGLGPRIGTGYPSYTSEHWVPFSSPLTTCRATAEVPPIMSCRAADQSFVTTDGLSVNMSWCRAHSGFVARHYLPSEGFCRKVSDERSGLHIRVRVGVVLRPTVSRPSLSWRLAPCGAHDQMLIFFV
jgi:hypothetical protein